MVEEDVHVTSVLKTADNNQVMYEASDPKASYTIVNPKAVVEDYNPAALKTFVLDQSRIDYNLVPPAECALHNTQVMHEGLPMSYLGISTVEEGTAYYKQTTKYPDMVCEMLARYEWGDLRHTTAKEFKNAKKRTAKKAQKPPPLQVKRGPIVVKFD